MRDLRSFSDETWDRFFDWLYDDVEDMPIEEVRQRLREAGIDTTKTLERVQEAIRRANDKA